MNNTINDDAGYMPRAHIDTVIYTYISHISEKTGRFENVSNEQLSPSCFPTCRNQMFTTSIAPYPVNNKKALRSLVDGLIRTVAD